MSVPEDSAKSMLSEIGLRDALLGIDTVGLGILAAFFVNTTRKFEARIEALEDENAGLNQRLLEIETQDLSKKNIDSALKSMSVDITRHSARISTLEGKVSARSPVKSSATSSARKVPRKKPATPPSSSASNSEAEDDKDESTQGGMVDDSSIFEEMDS